MVTMGKVWDRTTEVLGGRAGVLGQIAALTIFLPGLVRDAFVAYSAPDTIFFAVVGLVLSIVTIVLMVWGELAMLAIATDPTTTRAGGQAQATARLGAMIVVSVVIALAAFVVLLPPVIALVAGGVDLSAMRTGAIPTIPPGTAGFVGLYSLVLLVFAFWIGARLVLVNPVVLNERLSIGAIRRSVVLTRGLTWRILGVMLLFAIVLLIATSAAQLVAGVVLRLILGGQQATTVAFLAGAIGAVVTTIFTVIATVFTAQLYVAVAGQPSTDVSTPE